MNRKAIAVYLDNKDKFDVEFSWLWKTWKLWSLDEEWDLVVYHHPDAKRYLDKYTDIKPIEMKPIGISEIYPFLNSHYFCRDEYCEPLKKYDYLLKTDCDVFLTENLKGFSPGKFIVGQGGYYKQSDEKKVNYIKYLSRELGLNYNHMPLVGASFLGKTDDVIAVTRNQSYVTESIIFKYSKEQEFIDSGFHVGISSMIAGEVIINHSFTNQHVNLYGLDTKCWESTKIGSDVLHIHAWHTDRKWSKHDFFKGLYDGWEIDYKDAFKNVSNYCQWIAKIPIEKLNEYRLKYKKGDLEIDYDFIKNSEKFSVVIPTMWSSKRTLKLLKELNDCFLVDEIIIIDNNSEKNPHFNLKKCKIIKQEKNIYVNPAWNLGLRVSKNNLICLCNDDINFNVNSTFDFVLKNKNSLGCFGVHPNSYKNTSAEMSIESGYHTGVGGWGCLIFVKKDNWIEIPENLKIGYGDDWIAITNEPTFSILTDDKIHTEMSTTSGKKEFNSIVHSDIKTWKRIFRKGI